MTTNTSLKNIYQDVDLEKKEIDFIICHALKINTAALYIYDDTVSDHQIATIKSMCQQRIEGLPLAYITGFKEFWKLNLKVNKHTLIPRPETEQIVELVINKTKTNFSGTILDLGTGSGAIALSIAFERPKAHVIATDFSLKCVETATYNKGQFGLKNVSIIQSDWFKSIDTMKFDIIVSNPPYIAEGDSHLKNLKYEPISALTAKNNGLSDLYHIIENSRHYLNDKGLLILEHGHDQARTVRECLLKFCYKNVKSHNDLAGIPRITTAEFLKSCY